MQAPQGQDPSPSTAVSPLPDMINIVRHSCEDKTVSLCPRCSAAREQKRVCPMQLVGQMAQEADYIDVQSTDRGAGHPREGDTDADTVVPPVLGDRSQVPPGTIWLQCLTAAFVPLAKQIAHQSSAPMPCVSHDITGKKDASLCPQSGRLQPQHRQQGMWPRVNPSNPGEAAGSLHCGRSPYTAHCIHSLLHLFGSY